MTRVAHFVSFDIGGAGRTSLELVRLLARKYPDILIVYSDQSFPRYSTDTDHQKLIPNTFDEFKSLGEMQEIHETSQLNELNIGILHTHRSGDDFWFIPGLENLKRSFKIVETNFHGMQKTPADFRIFPSRSLMKFYGIENGVSNAVIPNAVNTLIGRNLRSNYGLDSNTLVFGRVGRSDKSIYNKNLIKQYSKIESTNTVLMWVGRSNLAETDALKYNVKNIIWVDPVADPLEMANLYATFDVYCHVNKLGETFGNTVAEAVIRGLPIASLEGLKNWPQAQTELIGAEQYCTSPRSFRNLLKKYRDHDKFREVTGTKNRDFGAKNLSSEIILKETVKIYESLMN